METLEMKANTNEGIQSPPVGAVTSGELTNIGNTGTCEDTKEGAKGKPSKKAEGKPASSDKGQNDRVRTQILRLNAIRLDPNIQPRAEMHPGAIADYGERMRSGDKFPPIIVFEVAGGKTLLVDGWHRYAAARSIELTTLEAEIHQGTRAEAIRYALQANTSHGLPRTNADKRRAVALALKAYPRYADRAIANMLKLSATFVSKLRTETQLSTVDSGTKRLGRDGKLRSMPKRKADSDNASSTTSNPGTSSGSMVDVQKELALYGPTPVPDEATTAQTEGGAQSREESANREWWERINAWLENETRLLSADELQSLATHLTGFIDQLKTRAQQLNGSNSPIPIREGGSSIANASL